MKRILAIAVLAVSGLNAQAGIDYSIRDDALSRDGSGSVMVIAVNDILTETLVWNTGLTAYDFYGGANDPFAISDSGVGDWVSNNIGVGITWTVLGLSQNDRDTPIPGFTAAPDFGIAHTGGPGATGGDVLVGTMTGLANFAQGVNTTIAPGTNDTIGDGVLINSDTNQAFYNDNLRFMLGTDTAAAINSQLDFWYTQLDPALLTMGQQTGAAVVNTLLGSFEFNFIPGGTEPSVTLTYQPEGFIPIPGAVWLFGSALIGLVGLRRRAA